MAGHLAARAGCQMQQALPDAQLPGAVLQAAPLCGTVAAQQAAACLQALLLLLLHGRRAACH